MFKVHSIRAHAALSMFVATSAGIAGTSRGQAVEYYFGGYDTVTPAQGTPSNPVSSALTVPGQVTVYRDAAGSTPFDPGTGPASSNLTDLILGGAAGAANYTVETPTANTTIHAIVLNSANGGTNTVNFNFVTTRYSMASLPAGSTSNFGTGITFRGNSNWNFVNVGGAGGPLRAQNSFAISGDGTGTLSIPFNLANTSGTPSMSVNLTGGGTLVLGARNDFSGSGGTPSFTLTNGTVDFRNSRAFGQLNAQIRLNGGTLLSSNGVSIDNGYVGTGGVAGETPIRIGGNVTFAGTLPWGTGNAGVTLTGNRTITANNASATGTTIPGVIGDNAGNFGLTVGALSTGRLTLTGANTYTGTTTVAGGTLVATYSETVPSAANPLLTGPAGVDLTGGRLILDHSASTSPINAVRSLLASGAPSNFATGQIRATTFAATPSRGIGYAELGGGQLAVQSTFYGDATLDGVVNVADLGALATNYGATDAVWGQGDFNYDAAVSVADLGLLATYYGSGTSLTAADAAAQFRLDLASVAASNPEFAAAMGIVPEPTTLAAAGLAALAFGRRRRRA